LNSKKNSQNATNINLTKENLLFLGLRVILGLGIAFGSKLLEKKNLKTI
jgi:hypothetical protein